jgi:hypothetical protein
MADAQPTCKVVLARTTQRGGRGARIYPKGCKVRAHATAGGGIQTYNKQGEAKIKKKVYRRDHRVGVNLGGRTAKLLYDTGAAVTTMTPGVARSLGLGRGGDHGTFSHHSYVRGVGGNQATQVYKDVGLQLDPTGERMRGEVHVGGTHNLLGVPHIRGAKRYKVKFKGPG